mgnify:CR=1 FL=1
MSLFTVVSTYHSLKDYGSMVDEWHLVQVDWTEPANSFLCQTNNYTNSPSFTLTRPMWDTSALYRLKLTSLRKRCIIFGEHKEVNLYVPVQDKAFATSK